LWRGEVRLLAGRYYGHPRFYRALKLAFRCRFSAAPLPAAHPGLLVEMRYRSLNTPEDFSKDLAAYTDLVGEAYLPALERLGEGLNRKGYVTEIDDLLYSLELDLFNLERNRRAFNGRFPLVPASVHEGVDFVIGVGQTIHHLSDKAKKDLQSDIIGRIKSKHGLRPLQHEFRIAGALSKSDYDVTFADREGGQGGFDFLAEKTGEAFEVEGKCVPAFLGQAVLPEDSEIFFLALTKRFRGWSDETSIPVLTVMLTKTLDTNQAMISKLVEACDKAALTRGSETIESYATVTFVHAAPKTNRDRLFEVMQIDSVASWARVFLSQGDPQVAVRLMSERPSRFVRRVLDTLSDSAKRQFSGNRPGVLWLHIDYLPPAIFDALANAPAAPSFLDLLALAVLNSPKRNHLCEVIFSGGAHLTRTGKIARSDFRKLVYQSPSCRFGNVRLFSPNKIIERSKAMESSKARSLLAEANLRFRIAAGPKQIVSAGQRQLMQRYATSTNVVERRIAANALFGTALQLDQQGRSDLALDVYDETLRFFDGATEGDIEELVAASRFNRGNVLGRLGRSDEALTAYNAVIARYGNTTRPDIAEKVGRALFNSGKIYQERPERIDQAKESYREIFERFKAAPSLYPSALAATALVNWGHSLGSADEALPIFDEVIDRFSDSEEDGVREQVEKALANKALVHTSHERFSEGLVTLNAFLARSPKLAANLEPLITLRKIDVLFALGREDEALKLSDRAMHLIKPVSDLSLKEGLASILLKKASILEERGNVSAAAETYDALIAKFGTYPDKGLLHLVNVAEQKKIEALTSLDRDDDAMSACDTLVARFYRNRSPSDLRETAAASLVFKGVLLERKGEPEKAVGAFSEALLNFGPSSETPAKNALNAFVERAGLLYDLDRYDEALADCDGFLAHFDAAGAPEAPQFVAKALLVKGVSLAATGHIADAINALEQVIERFSNAAADLVADLVLHAREILRQLRNDEGRV
jgi:tetratricopeptide (TPR) repeat protein